jgi:hypothetical protein
MILCLHEFKNVILFCRVRWGKLGAGLFQVAGRQGIWGRSSQISQAKMERSIRYVFFIITFFYYFTFCFKLGLLDFFFLFNILFQSACEFVSVPEIGKWCQTSWRNDVWCCSYGLQRINSKGPSYEVNWYYYVQH